MRFIVLGAGAIGGVVGARLLQAGHEVQLIARGSHYEAIAGDGLTLETPERRDVLKIAVASAPSEVRFTRDDVLLLATKSQDTAGALRAVRDAASDELPVVCLPQRRDRVARAPAWAHGPGQRAVAGPGG